MKLAPLFTVKENKLYKIDGGASFECFNEITDISAGHDFSSDVIYKIIINQKTIEPEAECYNEEFLAKLRDDLKMLEEKGVFAVLSVEPSDKAIAACNAEGEVFCQYVAAVKHTARRVKDCVSVAGIVIRDDVLTSGAPAEKESVAAEAGVKSGAQKIAYFIDELSAKHAQYVFLAEDIAFEQSRSLDSGYDSRIVKL